MAKSSDLVMMVLDASKEEGNNHRCGAEAASLLPCAVCVGLREGCYVLLGGGGCCVWGRPHTHPCPLSHALPL